MPMFADVKFRTWATRDNTCSLRPRPARLDSQSFRLEFLALDNVVFRCCYVNVIMVYIFVMSLFHNIFSRSFKVAMRQEGTFPSVELVVSPPFDNPHHVTFPDLHGFHLIGCIS